MNATISKILNLENLQQLKWH